MGGLISLSVVVRRAAIQKANEDRNLIRTGLPRSALRNRKLKRPRSSDGVRYYCRRAFSANEGRPWARCHTVVRGTWPFSARAAYVLRSFSRRPCSSAWLARSMIAHDDVDGTETTEAASAPGRTQATMKRAASTDNETALPLLEASLSLKSCAIGYRTPSFYRACKKPVVAPPLCANSGHIHQKIYKYTISIELDQQLSI